MPRLIDISPLVSERIGTWPGDVPFRREVTLDMRRGDNITLGAFRSTYHVGAHADAPSHYRKDGRPIAERDLELYYGACQVIAVSIPRDRRIVPEDVPDAVTAPRVLFRTGSFPDPDRFNEDFNSLSPELVDFLHARGVRTVGIDTPSVDPFASKALESHQALARHDMANLEGLVLDHVAPGRYTLIALPLKLAEADAAPLRAALLAE